MTAVVYYLDLKGDMTHPLTDCVCYEGLIGGSRMNGNIVTIYIVPFAFYLLGGNPWNMEKAIVGLA